MPREYSAWPKRTCEYCGREYAYSSHHAACKLRPRRAVIPSTPKSSVQFRFSLRLDMNELSELPPAKVAAIMDGIAKVIIAQDLAALQWGSLQHPCP